MRAERGLSEFPDAGVTALVGFRFRFRFRLRFVVVRWLKMLRVSAGYWLGT